MPPSIDFAPAISPQFPPPWAEVFGEDDFGIFAEFPLNGVRFVWRWIPPGYFSMGSPATEPGRFSDEGPLHTVTISRGFWLGEAPVTQSQWSAVVRARSHPVALGRQVLHELSLPYSPSHFQGFKDFYYLPPGELPVENVSWQQVMKFADLLNESLAPMLIEGLRFALPTEAEWEYACRAGSREALYTGCISILGTNHAPELDSIAWYGGNSGNQCELANPLDSKGWPEKQFDHSQAGTHRVKLKKPNAWGLYDMLGNVWEWCRDGRREYSNGDQWDPVGPLNADAFRVVRGGSWSIDARYCRAASRGRGSSGGPGLGRGFRLAASQQPNAAEPPGAERPQQPERQSRG